ncbi:hypothetical protein JANAI62_02700 [Jannaschia pagri]|uniref:Methyl-accepting chemotaxis protein n=1 Tax=Jannaschia pagri TaxID=2829797 RepID=A0ABQ4NGV6_9RHOB|nr:MULTISPECIES: methyl-accepting chemotaxis protein [unclassified Jannaschia]GIT90247.1 hypothetical protein JANAI61_07050 [Jannaschia sp. AI_61]GIT93647.1 hypothetical protein JANAI62_02700 [Jannaschia sp. AI_62]
MDRLSTPPAPEVSARDEAPAEPRTAPARAEAPKHPWHMSFMARSFAATAVLLIAGCALMYWVTARQVQLELGQQFQGFSQSESSNLVRWLRAEKANGPLSDAVLEAVVRDEAGPLVGIRVFDEAGGRMASYVAPEASQTISGTPVSVGPVQGDMAIDVENGLHVVQRVFQAPSSGGQQTVQFLYDTRGLSAANGRVSTTLLIVQAGLIFGAFLTVYGMLRFYISVPLQQAAASLQEIAEDRLDQALPPSRTAEVAAINHALTVIREALLERKAYAERSRQAEDQAAQLRAETERASAAEAAAAAAQAVEREQEAEQRLEEDARLKQDLEVLLTSADAGDFSSKMPLEGVPDSQQVLRTMLNGHFQQISQEFADVIELTTALGEGQLSVRLSGQRSGVFAALQDAVNRAASRTQAAFVDLHRHATEILDETSDLSASAEELSKRTEGTAGSLAETAGALEQITGSIAATARLAQDAKGFTEAARDDARQSDLVVQQAIESMREIQLASTEISKTLSVINDIAFQTNLLALNAGVEAARAGDAGRGFAVVASEVRALAQRASDAAQQIGEMISTSSDQVNLGVQRVARTGDTLGTLGERIDRIGDQVAEIALAANDQSGSVAEINRAMGEIDTATQQNTAMFEEMSTANLSLKAAAHQILAEIEKFERFEAGGLSAEDHAGLPSARFSATSNPEAPALDHVEEFGVLTADAEEVRKWDMAICHGPSPSRASAN